ncbi:MAG TPA: carboxypeptidase-like regulatory domain-containing protein [Trebonia sp.]
MDAERGASLAGTVRRPDGRPAEGAAVTVAEAGTGRQAGTTRTAPSGTFRIALSAGGTYLVIVAAPGRQPAAELVAVNGDPVRHDVVLQAGSGTLAGTARTAGSGDPVPGAVITLADAQGQVAASAVTGADGRYRLGHLDAGDYTLAGLSGRADPVARAVTVPGTQDLVFAAPGSLVAAVVTRPDGAPFPGAVVTLSGSGGTVASGVSDGQGAVAFEDVPDDSYTLAAEGSGPGVAAARAERGQVARADIRLGAPGGAADEPDSWFLPGPRFSPEVR